MMSEEESSAGKYTERVESVLGVLGLRNTPMVNLGRMGLVLWGDPFLM